MHSKTFKPGVPPGLQAATGKREHRSLFVSVPKELRIRKAKGATTVIELHKVGDAIEVEALR